MLNENTMSKGLLEGVGVQAGYKDVNNLPAGATAQPRLFLLCLLPEWEPGCRGWGGCEECVVSVSVIV